jgi:hypothetical protein
VTIDGILFGFKSEYRVVVSEYELAAQPSPRKYAERRGTRGRHRPSVARILQADRNHEWNAGAGHVGIPTCTVCTHGRRLHGNRQGTRRIAWPIVSEGCGANQR